MRIGKDFVTVAEQFAHKARLMRQFVVYRRVSTKDQGLDGLGIVDELNQAGIPTAQGGSWHAKQVQRVLKRLAA